MKSVTIEKNDSNQRLDKFLTKSYPNLPKALMYKYIRLKRIKVNGKRAEISTRLNVGDVVDMYINYLAYGMVNIVNIFQPQVFAIGGGVCGEGDYLLDPVKAIVDRDQYGTNSHDDKTVIKIAELGNDAGIIGAASLGL